MLVSLLTLLVVGSLLDRAVTDILALTLIHANTLVVLAVWVIMARGAQDDLEGIGYSVMIPRLAPSPMVAWFESGIGLVLGVVLLPFLTNTSLAASAGNLAMPRVMSVSCGG